MATRPFTAEDETVDGVLTIDRPGVSRIYRYQLNVVAASMADVVLSAGGWLCDCARAGWDVNVLVAGHDDPRPLTILGATALDLDAEFSALVKRVGRGGALAVSVDLLRTDTRVRDEVLGALKRGLTEVTVWGDRWPAELGRQVDPVQHRISSAARAFKSYAIAAAAVSKASSTGTETLFRLGTGTFRPLYSV
jgi:hypothetical protein